MYELLNEKEVAKLIGMSVYWLRRCRWVGNGIPYVKMDGVCGSVRYRREDVEAFLDARVKTNTSQIA